MDSKDFMFRYGRNTLHTILNWVYPAQCFACGQLIQEANDIFCSHCWTSVQPVGMDDQTTHLKHSNGLDHAYCGWYFTSEIQRVIHSLKYEDYAKLGFQLGMKIIDLLEPTIFQDVHGLIPIPLHAVKYRERGYNQSYWIACGMAKRINVPVLNALKRIRYTQSQTKLTAEERKQNVSQAFIGNKKVAGLSLILVDDVLTTGSTVLSAAQSLKAVGARRVTAITLSTPR